MSDHVLSMQEAPPRLATYWVAAGTLLLGEYLFISLLFDVGQWMDLAGPLSILGYLGEFATVGAVAVFGTLLLRGEVILDDLRALYRPQTAFAHARMALVHVLSYLALIIATARLFAVPDPARFTVPGLLLWILCGLLTVVSLLLVLSPPRALLALIPRVAPAFGVGFIAGVVIFGFGQLSAASWGVLGAFTLHAVHYTLTHLSAVVLLDTDRAMVGTPDFWVEVAPVCSGFEGIGLILVFLGGYLVLNRSTLRFPRALLVLPLAVVTVWIANVARIAALILIGSHLSPEVALGGFHSRAGWVFFCLVALGFIVWLRDAAWVARSDGTDRVSDPLIAHQATSMLVPLLALLGTSLITGLFAADIDLLYAARIVAAIVPLWIWRAELRPLARRPSAGSALIGALVFAVWFVFTERENAHGDQLRAEVEALGGALGGLWIATRVLGSVLVVPVAEELAFRAYLLRRLVAPDFASVPMGMLKVGPLILSSLAFGLLHGDWIAGSAAGLGYGLAQVRGGRVTDAITAHAVTNALIALDVLLLGSWAQW